MTQRSDDPKLVITLRVRQSTLERMQRSPVWRLELQNLVETKYGKALPKGEK